MVRLNHENIGAVQKTAYLTATIVSVDSEFDTAAFTGIGKCPSASDIPIFYHCEPDSEQRDNGALEGAASAFAEDDEVIVQCEVVSSTEYKPLYVIGFVDKPKSCGFRFKLTRGDETLITEAGGLLTYIRLYNSDDVSVSITTPEYNVNSEEWSFNLADSADADKDGYWIDYLCEDGIATQYPYKYKDSEKDEPEDLIQVGTYEDIIPYWVVSDIEYNPVPYEAPVDLRDADIGWGCVDVSMLGVDGVAHTGYSGSSRYYLGSGKQLDRKINIKSSIPYKITRFVSMSGSIPYTWLHDQYQIVPFLAWDYEEDECVNVGTYCYGTSSTWSNDNSMSVTFSGGDLNYECLRSDLRDVEVEDIDEYDGVIGGVEHIITALNTSLLSVDGTDQSGNCHSNGSLMWAVFGKKDVTHQMVISADYDY